MFRKKQKEPIIELCELWSLWEADLWKMQGMRRLFSLIEWLRK